MVENSSSCSITWLWCLGTVTVLNKGKVNSEGGIASGTKTNTTPAVSNTNNTSTGAPQITVDNTAATTAAVTNNPRL